jgi:uncharacterized damage-inducible protein DinB
VNLSDLRMMFDYSYWARDKLLAAMEGIADEELDRDLGLNYGDLWNILRHCLAVERLYRTATLHGGSEMEPLEEEKISTGAGLTEVWREEEGLMREYLDSLTEAVIEEKVSLTRRSGDAVAFPRWQLLMHLANHSMQHRSEAAEALTMLGRSPGNLDMLYYFMDRNSANDR